MGRYMARIAAMRADKLRLTAIGVFPIVIDFDAMFTADKEMEDRV